MAASISKFTVLNPPPAQVPNAFVMPANLKVQPMPKVTSVTINVFAISATIVAAKLTY